MNIQRKNIKCPICKKGLNSLEPISYTARTRTFIGLGECWSGDIHKEKPKHLFIIKLKGLKEFTRGFY